MVEKLAFGALELAYELQGSGEPVVLLHALAFVGLYAPLLPLMPGRSVLRYERRLLDRIDASSGEPWVDRPSDKVYSMYIRGGDL